MTFGKKLQLLRRQNGMSQEQLAAELSVSRQAVSKWELENSLPETDKIILLSKLFRVSTDYLLLEEEEETGHSSTDRPEQTIQRSQSAKSRKILGIACIALGALGTLVIYILSTMISVHVLRERQLPDGTIEYYGGSNVMGYDYSAFVSEYRLQAIETLCVLLIIAGIVLLFWKKIEKYLRRFIEKVRALRK